ncbi:MAG: hypothetical protein K2X69_05000 [Silvanigrellaceae bacterium]|nr:hypothetical protein [Silvanigrellaceae bacterium]
MTQNQFKNLPLNRELIPLKLKEHCDTIDITEISKSQINYKGTKDNKEFQFSQYNIKSGETTLTPSTKNTEKSNEIIKYIADECLAGDGKTISISTKLTNSKENFFCQIIEYLNEYQCSCKKTNISNGEQLRITSIQGDSISMNLYGTGTLTIQGKNIITANLIFSFIQEFLSLEEIAKIKNDFINSSVNNLDRIEIELKEKIGGNIFALLDSCSRGWCRTTYLFSTEKYSIPQEISDLSFYLIPLVRSFEFIIKKIFINNNIRLTKNKPIGEYFERIRPNAEFSLKNSSDTTKIDEKHKKTLELCYILIHQERHPISHADGIDESSVIISSVAILSQKVEKCFGIFKKCSEILNN